MGNFSINKSLARLSKTDFKKWFDGMAKKNDSFKDKNWEEYYNQIHPVKKSEDASKKK